MAFHFEIFWLDACATIILIVGVIIYYIKQQYQFWESQGISQIPGTFPMGSGKDILRTKAVGVYMEEFHKHFRALKQPVGGYYFGLRPELLIIDPAIIRNILIKDFAYFTDRSLYWNPHTDPLTNNLFTMRNGTWHRNRKKLTSLFTTSKVKMAFPVLQTMSKRLYKIVFDAAETGEPINIAPVMFNYTADEIGAFVYGIECNCLTNKDAEIRRHIDDFFAPKGFDRVRYFFAYSFPNVMTRMRIRALNYKASRFFLNITKEIIKYREDNNLKQNDFLDILRQKKNKAINNNSNSLGSNNESEELTFTDIAGHCYSFFAAGYETSAQTENFCLYELAYNQDIQNKVRNEIGEVTEKYNGEVTYDAIMEMKYLDKVVHETLRKYPPIPFITRNCTKDYLIPTTKFLIRKGQVITIPLLGIQRDPEYYPHPEIFDPERFSEEEKRKRTTLTFFPFGEGPRYCIGAKLGLVKVKMGIITVIRNHRITLNSKTKSPLEFSPKYLALSAKGGIWLNITSIS